MNVDEVLRYLDQQGKAIQAVVDQLDEVQVAFNAQFDEFKAGHDTLLDRLSDQVAAELESTSPSLRASIEERVPEENKRINERRQKVGQEYLPQRQQAADDLLEKAQAELAELRALNPQLDVQEEALKGQMSQLETRLEELNEDIRHSSRGLGVVVHFLAITKADRERHRIVGKLEALNESLYRVRSEWEQKRKQTEAQQLEYQKRWQLESMAVARLQAELEQLNDEARRKDLAQRRAIRHVLDALKELPADSDPALDAELRGMVELNVQTDAYHEGLASVGGMIGLAGGIRDGLQAIGQSIKGLKREQQMHKAYLKQMSFTLPSRVEAFHKRWPALAQQFADERVIGAHPAAFSATVQPLLEGPLSEASIEAMFADLGKMIERATAQW